MVKTAALRSHPSSRCSPHRAPCCLPAGTLTDGHYHFQESSPGCGDHTPQHGMDQAGWRGVRKGFGQVLPTPAICMHRGLMSQQPLRTLRLQGSSAQAATSLAKPHIYQDFPHLSQARELLRDRIQGLLSHSFDPEDVWDPEVTGLQSR